MEILSKEVIGNILSCAARDREHQAFFPAAGNWRKATAG